MYECHHHHHHHHHYYHISFMELGHLLTRSGLTYPEVSSNVYHDSFCQKGSSVLLSWEIYFEAFYLHVLSSFSCIPVICPHLVLFLNTFTFVHLYEGYIYIYIYIYPCNGPNFGPILIQYFLKWLLYYFSVIKISSDSVQQAWYNSNCLTYFLKYLIQHAYSLIFQTVVKIYPSKLTLLYVAKL
jgi:hypothetical protein